MKDRSRNYSDELANIMNAISESTLELTDDEIEDEVRDEGGDPDASAERVKGVIREAVKACELRPLMEAQRRYDERVAALEVKKYRLPELPADQRLMIAVILAGNPQLGGGTLTAQFREYEGLPDEEVEGYLKQLLELTGGGEAGAPAAGEK